MSRYTVTLDVTRISTYEVEIEADSLEQAQEAAWEMDPWKYEMLEVDEVTSNMELVAVTEVPDEEED